VPLFLAPCIEKLADILMNDSWPSPQKVVFSGILGLSSMCIGLRAYFDGSYERDRVKVTEDPTHKNESMKTLITIIGVAALLATTTQAQTVNPESKSNAIAFVQGVSAEKNLTIGISPSYAPDLINANGVKDQWGACLALTYHPQGAVGQYTFAGIRLDYLGSQFYAPSIAGGLKADVQLFGINVTPFAYTGAAVPLSGAGKQNGDWGTIVGGGAKVSVWNGNLLGLNANLSIAVAAEKWSQFDGVIYHGGPLLRLSW
jgi:hypothetical protein